MFDALDMTLTTAKDNTTIPVCSGSFCLFYARFYSGVYVFNAFSYLEIMTFELTVDHTSSEVHITSIELQETLPTHRNHINFKQLQPEVTWSMRFFMTTMKLTKSDRERLLNTVIFSFAFGTKGVRNMRAQLRTYASAVTSEIY
jgi:hypothetical protein